MPDKLHVIARNAGHYGGHRRPGDRFELLSADDFAPNWMQAVGWEPAGPAPDQPAPKPGPTAEEHANVLSQLAEVQAAAKEWHARALELHDKMDALSVEHVKERQELRDRIEDLEAQLAAATAPKPVAEPPKPAPAPAPKAEAKTATKS